MKIEVFKHLEEAKLPTKNKPTDAGFDLFSIEEVYIPVGQTRTVDTGVSINIPEGYFAKIEDRSSYGIKGLRTGAGVVDAGYSGSIKVVIHNLNNRSEAGSFTDGYRIKKGDKITQFVVLPVPVCEINEVSSLWNSERGSNGFGSSGS